LTAVQIGRRHRGELLEFQCKRPMAESLDVKAAMLRRRLMLADHAQLG